MVNPVLAEVTRGPLVESRHRGAVAVSDAHGHLLLALGDVGHPIYPRSAVKALQALPLVETGAADAFGFGHDALALACASHNGEPRHVQTAAAMLEAAGLSEADLACGPQPPRREEDVAALQRRGVRPGPLHNNCSGKHAGMLAVARHLGFPAAGYERPAHPVQRLVRATIEEVCGTALRGDACGIDGCSIPTWALPIQALARGFARFATGEGFGEARAAAAARLRRAAASAPHMVAGQGRFCTELMSLLGARVYAKTGAEGVFCAAIPERGLGVALKVDDGAGRAAEVMMAHVVHGFCRMSAAEARSFQRFLRPTVRNWRGVAVGEVRAVEPLSLL